MPTFPYRKALIIGATSGIGQALTETLLEANIHVLAVGRRKENLAALAEAHTSNLTTYAFDITQLPEIPAFARKITAEHADCDFILINSGIQRSFDFTNPQSVDFGTLEMEFTTNYLAHVHLAMAFLPHLQALSATSQKTALAFTTSSLGLVPLVRCANYSASKAAMHSWILCTRQQLRASGQAWANHLKVVEILPPAVQTELHDAKHQPDIKDGGKIGMPLDEFTQKMYQGLCEGREQIIVGPMEGSLEEGGWEWQRQQAFQKMVKMMSK